MLFCLRRQPPRTSSQRVALRPSPETTNLAAKSTTDSPALSAQIHSAAHLHVNEPLDGPELMLLSDLSSSACTVGKADNRWMPHSWHANPPAPCRFPSVPIGSHRFSYLRRLLAAWFRTRWPPFTARNPLGVLLLLLSATRTRVQGKCLILTQM